MFYIDLWEFTNDPLYLGYNSIGQKNLVLCFFFTFRDLNGVKLSSDFGDANISPKEAYGALGSHEEGLEGQKRLGGAPSKGGRTTLALLSLSSPFRLIISPIDFI
jgi:hypothetical protein